MGAKEVSSQASTAAPGGRPSDAMGTNIKGALQDSIRLLMIGEDPLDRFVIQKLGRSDGLQNCPGHAAHVSEPVENHSERGQYATAVASDQSSDSTR